MLNDTHRIVLEHLDEWEQQCGQILHFSKQRAPVAQTRQIAAKEAA